MANNIQINTPFQSCLLPLLQKTRRDHKPYHKRQEKHVGTKAKGSFDNG